MSVTVHIHKTKNRQKRCGSCFYAFHDKCSENEKITLAKILLQTCGVLKIDCFIHYRTALRLSPQNCSIHNL